MLARLVAGPRAAELLASAEYFVQRALVNEQLGNHARVVELYESAKVHKPEVRRALFSIDCEL